MNDLDINLIDFVAFPLFQMLSFVACLGSEYNCFVSAILQNGHSHSGDS